MTSSTEIRSSTAWALLVLLCLFHLVAGSIYFSQVEIPPSYDCANHLNISLKIYHAFSDSQGNRLQNLLEASPYYPPLPHALAALFFTAGGIHPDSAHASLLVWLVLLILSTYEAGRILYSRNAGLLAATLVSFYPIVFGLTRSFYPDLATLALCSSTFTCFLKSKGLTNRKWSLLFGLSAGLAQMSKWTAILFWIGPVIAYWLPQLLEPLQQENGKNIRRFINRLLLIYLTCYLGFAFLFDVLTDLSRRAGGGYVAKLFVATLLFHGFLLIGLLFGGKINQVKEILSQYRESAGSIYPRMKNLILAILLAVILCLPWYYQHGSFIRYSTILTATQDAAYRGFPSISSPGSLLKYFFFFENHQVHLLFFLLFLFALGVSLVKARDTLFPLLFGLLIAYLAMTCIRLKDPRFTLPFLYLPALITAGGLLCLSKSVLKNSLVGIAVGGGLIQFCLITFGPGLSPDPLFLPTRYGEMVLWKGTGYGSFEWKGQTWPVEEAVRELNRSFAESSLKHSSIEQPYRIYTLVNHHCLHYEAFNFYAKADRYPLQFEYPPLKADGQGIDMDFVYEIADALVIKRGGDLGPEFSIPGLREAIQILCDPNQETVFGFQRIHSYPLPDATWMDLWIGKEKPVRDRIPISLNFDGLGKLLAYSFGPPEIERGEKAILKVRMEVTPELIQNYHLFIHLYNPSNEFLGSFGGPFPVEPQTGSVEMLFPVDTSQALAGGLAQLAIGIWNPKTGARLKIMNDDKNELGDIIYLDAFTEIRNTSDENRAQKN